MRAARLFARGVFFVIIFCFVFTSLPSNASPAPNWSWTADFPVVVSSVPAARPGEDWCQSTIYQQYFVEGELGAKDICMMASSSVRFGLYREANDLVTVIGFGNDEKLYKINIDCSDEGQCLYLPETDILVTKQDLDGNGLKNLVYYKNFTTQLEPVFGATGLRYSLKSNAPKTIFQTESGFNWSVMGVGASSNGKWLAVEVKATALLVFNLENGDIKRITNGGYTYDQFIDQISELAISNDGAQIAWMGKNAALLLYDNEPGCGDAYSEYNLSLNTDIPHECPLLWFDEGEFNVADYAYGSWPKYSDDGGELSFFAFSEDDLVSNKVLGRASGYAAKNLDYLAMGDSYSSGEGELESQYYIQGTNSEFEKCHTSSHSYPFVIANIFNRDISLVKSVACSGAKTIDIVGSDYSYWGQGGRLGLGQLNLNFVDKLGYQAQALEQFITGRIHQNSFVSKYKPSTITIGIGGNDAGFMEKLSNCLAPGTCKWASSVDGRERTALQIRGLFKTLVNTFSQIREASPLAKIYAIGYPKIIDPNGSCNATINALFDGVERQYIVDSITYLNQVISAAADSAGVKFVDIYDGFGDHVICGSDTSAVNTIKIGDDIGLFDNAHWYRFIGQESFHPNSLGHSLTAQAIIKNVGNIFTDVVGPVNPATGIAPEPPAALLPDGYHNLPAQIVADFVQGRNGPSPSLDIEINMAERSFAPNSTVNITGYDDMAPFGQLMADKLGALKGKVTLPDNLAKKSLTLYLLGISFSGEPIEISDTIETWDPTEPPESIVDPETPPADDDEDDNPEVPAIIEPTLPIVPAQPPIIEALVSDLINLPPTIIVPEPKLAITDELFAEPEVLGDSIVKNLPSIIEKPAVNSVTGEEKSVPNRLASIITRSWLIPGSIFLVVLIVSLITRKILRRKNKSVV